MAHFSGLIIASALTYVAGKRVVGGIAPVHQSLPAGLAAQYVAAPPILAADLSVRTNPLDEGIRKAMAAAPIVDQAAGDHWGSMWESTFSVAAISDEEYNSRLYGTWLTEEGADQWSFEFKFGRYGRLECIIDHGGDRWFIKDLVAEFGPNGQRGVTSGFVPNGRGTNHASFCFELDERFNPKIVKATIHFPDSKNVIKQSAVLSKA
mmetsp:Transcript_11769/g.33897  ORF Transcript_11769/g.33897 Transcript_11769/m.33897 type:complete len:207 (+) Transcript_11769:50-670(+)|eukprot:CAMPEP_0176074818 /NCGR_PEP_ID=MMETSP0120_2-20121206/37392_1 /TAXON_ID=160619 /ORGANISM="Kryptoperidinium foliaceum, Strain CCMP 1326" /LENGTH=206 /DNA_ID=CAMNT_0017408517 /DNA_START=45 /DNA_END=665 /DNA_ORIENTATION=-